MSLLVGYAAMLLIATLTVLGTDRDLPRRALLVLAGSAAIGPLAAILHNVIGALLGQEEPVFFVIAVVVAPLAFAAAAFAIARSLLLAGSSTDLAAALITSGIAIVLLPLNAGSPEWIFIALALAVALALWDLFTTRSAVART